MASIDEDLKLAWKYQEIGDISRAEHLCRQILERDPRHADSCHLLGLLAYQSGRHDQAAHWFRQAVALNPSVAWYHSNLGMAQKALGQLDAAIANYRQALTLNPDAPKTHNNLANALQSGGDLDGAITHYQAALRLNPHSAEVYNNLAAALTAQGQAEEAVALCKHALELKPDYAEGHSNMGYALYTQGPGKLDEAAACLESAIRLRPELAGARWNRSLIWLLQGDYERGWPEYEWRWTQPGFAPPRFPQPVWDGAPFPGRTILLYAEQGFGDMMQFVRFVPLVKKLGGKVILESHAPLLRLLANAFGQDQLAVMGQPLPAFDLQAALGSLPGIFHTSVSTILCSQPYLEAEPALVEKWRAALRPLQGFKIAIAWQGSTTHPANRQRSIPVEFFTRLAQVPGVQLISIQRGPGAEQLLNNRHLSAICYRPEGIDEAAGAFMDTAAVMKNVDLVMCSDTAVAHLAGALGVPVWVALPFVPDWRWLLQREDSPWYPSMRLFRQSQRGHWEDVFDRMAKALSLIVGSWCQQFAEAHLHLGNTLIKQGRLANAAASFQQALRLKPDYADVHLNLGTVFRAQGLLDEAIAAYQMAFQLKPDYAGVQNNLGNVFMDQGRLDDAIVAFRAGLRLKPDAADIHSNLVFVLPFHPAYDCGAIQLECRRWNKQHAESLKGCIQQHTNHRDPDRPLRIGYVSPDFREHVQRFFTVPLLSHHNHRDYEIFCYADVLRPDAITERLRGNADNWRNTVGLSDEQVADLVRSDEIDILVDLTMHMARNRLLVFARKPAPVQVAWLAYPGTTGLAAMDYRLTDPYLDPPGLFDAFYSEESIRLPDTFWCYDPLVEQSLPVNALPFLRNGVFTFGCLNNFWKINDGCLALWAKVLHAVPQSRLLLLAPGGQARERLLAKFEQEGIAAQRVELVDKRRRLDYLKLYHRIDLGLDPMPYNGHTTSLDAFWMGVPTVTLVSTNATFGRAGWSQLCNLDLKELAAQTPEQYVQLAAQLAGDPVGLDELRGTLRQRMQQSPLMDGERFARNIEQAYREMWRRWCR